MNLAVHALEGDIKQANSYYEDPHSCLNRFDFVMANPPFNVDRVDRERSKTIRDSRSACHVLIMPTTFGYNCSIVRFPNRGAQVSSWRTPPPMPVPLNSTSAAKLSNRGQLMSSSASPQISFILLLYPVRSGFSISPNGTAIDTIKSCSLTHGISIKQVSRAHREFTPGQLEFLANIVRLYRGEAPENPTR